MPVGNPNLADLLGSELNQVPATEEVDLAALLQSNLNMTPSHPLPSPPSSSENLLDSLLTSDLNDAEVLPGVEQHPPLPHRTSQHIPLDDLLQSDLNSVPMPQCMTGSPAQPTSQDEILQGLLTSDLNSAISRKRTLDQLLESDLNLSPSRSQSPVPEHVANRPRTLSPPSKSQEILSREQARLDVLLESDLNGDPQEGEDPMDGVEGEEKEEKKWNVGQEDMPGNRGYSWRGILDIESRVFKVIGEFNREEEDLHPSVDILLERKTHACNRYSELLRDKMTLWEVREQLEASERALMRILK